MAAKPSSEARLDAVVNLAKRRGFVFPCGEIYGGTRSAWDYGPLGRRAQGQHQAAVVARHGHEPRRHRRPRLVGDPAPPGVGGLRSRRGVHRPAGRVPVLPQALPGRPPRGGVRRAEGPRPRASTGRDRLPELRHPGLVDRADEFNGLLKTYLGPVEDESGLHYLRPETAQGIFVNFNNVEQSARKKPPFGIGQIGKSFRNEITPGNFIFRTREFEQMEMEFFVEPGHRRGVAPVLDRHPHRLVRRPRASTATTCVTTSTRRRSCRTTRSAPSTSSTASASRVANGASSRASPTAPTST